MKKLKLQTLGLSVNDLLTREQMKSVMGGSGGGSGVVADCSCTNGRKCAEGTTSCSVTTINNVEKISCNGSAYTNC